MHKRNYSSWAVSIGLHALLITAILTMRLPVLYHEAAPNMKAYVTVNLASLPNLTPSPTKTTPQNVQSFTDRIISKEDTSTPNSDATTTTDKKLNNIKPKEAHLKDETSSVRAKPKLNDVTSNNESTRVAAQTNVIDTSQSDFKKLNPYRRLPQISTGNFLNEEKVTFGYPTHKSKKEMTINDRITVPSEDMREESSQIIAVSAGGSKRVEKWRGKCYDVDLATVFGKSGMPQGGPRLCPGEKSDDQVLLEKSMEKWGRVSQTK